MSTRPGWLRAPGNTLAVRLFVLMWVALVLSHLTAFLSVRSLFEMTAGTMTTGARPPGDLGNSPAPPKGLPGEAREHAMPPMPPFPSLPPTGRPGGPAGAGHTPPGGPDGLPWSVLVLDYGIRMLLIAAAAWWGSRWLAQPMARLVESARALGPALARHQPPQPLDEHEGTQEVRAAAAVFNQMATQIQQQFEGRALMIAAISHDLRTPLTRMRMRMETAEVSAVLRTRCIADLREMNALIDTVLEVFRSAPAGAAALQRTDVTALVQALVDDREELGAQLSLQGPTVVLRTEPMALRRVLGNLVDNALRYAGSAELQVEAAAGQLQLRVLDRGPGIPESRLSDVLQPFTRLEGSRNSGTGGTGLGLFIAYELTQRLGGELSLSNRPGGGLCAQVTLPQEGG